MKEKTYALIISAITLVLLLVLICFAVDTYDFKLPKLNLSSSESETNQSIVNSPEGLSKNINQSVTVE